MICDLSKRKQFCKELKMFMTQDLSSFKICVDASEKLLIYPDVPTGLALRSTV